MMEVMETRRQEYETTVLRVAMTLLLAMMTITTAQAKPKTKKFRIELKSINISTYKAEINIIGFDYFIKSFITNEGYEGEHRHKYIKFDFKSDNYTSVGENYMMIRGGSDLTLNQFTVHPYPEKSFEVKIRYDKYWFYGHGKDESCFWFAGNDPHIICLSFAPNEGIIQVEIPLYINEPIDDSNTTIIVPDGDYWVSDDLHTPKPACVVTYKGEVINQYELICDYNWDTRTATVTAHGDGDYCGYVSATYPIRRAKYTVAFDKNHPEANGSMADMDFTYNTPQDLAACSFTAPSGYVFDGWTTNPDGTGDHFTDAQSVNNLTPEDGATVTLYARWVLELGDNANNTDAIEALSVNGGTSTNMKLSGRTLWKDGDWNTLCLPFSLGDATASAGHHFDGTPLEGATLMELDTETEYDEHMTGVENGTLYLNFKDAESIEAGKPYIVKWPIPELHPTSFRIVEPSPAAMSALNFITEVPRVTGGRYTNWNLEYENFNRLVDGKTDTKYVVDDTRFIPCVDFYYAAPIIPKGYALWTSNGYDGERNPREWTIKAKNKDDADWTTLTKVSNYHNEMLPLKNNTCTVFSLDNNTAYQYFRFEAKVGAWFQLAELQFCTEQPESTQSYIENPTFASVTIEGAVPVPARFIGGQFVGTYDPIKWTSENKSILFLGSGSTLCYPESGASINAFRSYFDLTDGSTSVKAFNLNFGRENEVSEVNEVLLQDKRQGRAIASLEVNDDSWYTLDGRKLQAKPTVKGLYINGGRKVVIK